MDQAPSSDGGMIVVLAGRPGSLADEVKAGVRPNMEYLELIDRHGMTVVSYDDLDRSGRWLRALARVLGPNWALSVLCARRHGERHVLIATGDDLGFRLALVLGLLRRRTHRSRLAIISHGSYLNSRRAPIVGRLLRRRDDASFLCLSSSLERLFVRCFGLSRAQVTTVGYGVDTTFFEPSAATSESSTFRVVSAGMANRDYRTLIDAMRAMPGELKIAADSEWFKSDLDLDDVEVPGHVEIRSYGNYVNLRRLYASANVVVVPLHEGKHACGYAVIAEAMAMGRVVIATLTEGQSDFIVDGETGYYVAPGDRDSLRHRLQYLADNPALVTEMGVRARTAIASADTVVAYADRIARVASEMAERAS